MFLCGCKCRGLRASTGRRHCFIRGAGLIRSCILLFLYSALLCSTPLCSPFSSSALLYQTFLSSCLLCSIVLFSAIMIFSALVFSALPFSTYPSVFCFLYLFFLLYCTPRYPSLVCSSSLHLPLLCSLCILLSSALPFPTLFLSALLDLHYTDPQNFCKFLESSRSWTEIL